MNQSLVRRIQNRMAKISIDPAQDRRTDPPGKLHDLPGNGTECQMLWPGHMDVRQEYADAGTGDDQ